MSKDETIIEINKILNRHNTMRNNYINFSIYVHKIVIFLIIVLSIYLVYLYIKEKKQNKFIKYWKKKIKDIRR